MQDCGTSRAPGMAIGIAALVLAAGCSAGPQPLPLYERPGLTVTLMYDSRAGSGHSHPVAAPVEQIKAVLQGLRLHHRDVMGTLGLLGDDETTAAFGPQEAAELAPHVSAGLAKASPHDLVAFHMVQRDARRAPLVTSGGIFVRGRHLYIILANAKTSPSSLQYETPYEPDSRANPLLPITRFKYAVGYVPAGRRIPMADAKRADGWDGYLDESKVVVVDLDARDGHAGHPAMH